MRFEAWLPAEFNGISEINTRYKAGLDGKLCEGYVNYVLNEKETYFRYGSGNEIRFDDQLNLIGGSVQTIGGTEVTWGVDPLLGFYKGIKTSRQADIYEGNQFSILSLQAENETQQGFKVRQPNWNWNYAYRQFQAIATIENAKKVFVGITAAVLIILVDYVFSRFGLPAPAPAMIAPTGLDNQAQRVAPNAQLQDADPVLLGMLKQSYGAIVDTSSVRPMQLNQVDILANGNTTNGITDMQPVIQVGANGFAPNTEVLVAVDRAGDPISTQILVSDSAGDISGSIPLPDSVMQEPTTLTVIAIDNKQVEDNLNIVSSDVNAAPNLAIAASAIAIESAPRLENPVAFSPTPIIAGQLTRATFTVRNTGDVPLTLKRLLLAVRGPDCPNWCDDRGADWTGLEDVTIPPQSTITVSSERAIEIPGRYIATAVYQDTSGNWHDVEASNRFEFDVLPSLVVIEPITITPSDPQAGETITVKFRVKNNSGQWLFFDSVVADGRGPDCIEGWACQKWASTPTVRGIQLAPNEEYGYEQRIVFTEPGTYFFQPLYKYTENDWHLIGSRYDFQVGQGVEVVTPLQLSNLSPISGEQVVATYTLRNNGKRAVEIPYLGVVARGPNCTEKSWTCGKVVDFPWIGYVTIQPGGTYTYRSAKSFDEAGSGFWAEPQMADINPWWKPFHGANLQFFNVQPGIAITTPLTLTPPNPVAGQLVKAIATIQNQSSRQVTLRRLFVGAQGPNCQDFNCSGQDPSKWGDFPAIENLTLLPGQTYTYEKSRLWIQTGDDYIAQLMFQFGQDDWHLLGSRPHFSVTRGLEILSPLKMYPTTPKVNQPYQVSYSLFNSSTQSITLPAIGVGGQKTDCTTEDCANGAGMDAFWNITIPPGQRYDYISSRFIGEAGTYWIEPFMVFTSPELWWGPISLNNGQRLPFEVLGDIPPLPACTMSINGGSTFTNQREVDLAANTPGATRWVFSNDGGFYNAQEFPANGMVSWMLPDTGTTISVLTVRLRAFNVNMLLCNGTISDEIIFDPQAPKLQVNWEADKSNSVHLQSLQTVVSGTLKIDAADQTGGSGVSLMQIANNPAFSNSFWEPYSETRSVVGETSSVLYIRVKDGAGNISTVVKVQVQEMFNLYLPAIVH